MWYRFKVKLLLSGYNSVLTMKKKGKSTGTAKSNRTAKTAKAVKAVRELSWVKRGKQRREIIVHISGEQTPTEVAKDSGYSLNHTSRILNELKRHKLVKLLNPEEKTGRLYVLTPSGKVIKDKLKSS